MMNSERNIMSDNDDESGTQIEANNLPSVSKNKKSNKKEDIVEKPFICVYTNESDLVGFKSEDLVSIETIISNNTTYSYSRSTFLRITLQTKVGIRHVEIPVEFKEKLVEALRICVPVIVLKADK